MGGRSGYVWVYGTGLMALAIWGYVFVTDPPNRPFTMSGPLMAAFAGFVIVRSKQWLEVTDDDVALVQQRTFKTVRVQLKDAREIYLRGNGGGTAQIVAVGVGVGVRRPAQ